MLRQAYEYKVWSDMRTLGAVEQMSAQRYASEHAFVLQQLNHMVIVEELFRARLRGLEAPHETTNTAQVPGFTELQARLCAGHRWYTDYIEALDPADLETKVGFTFTDGKPGAMSRWEILFHVLNHGTYHRGAISKALDRAGVPHPVDGYAAYAHRG